jgi:putative addiction module component (TIGR02574 family)
MSYDEILEKAMALPRKKRGALAEELIDSLEPDEEDDLDPELRAVVERRLAELESGLVKPVPAEEVHERVKAKLRAARRISSRG